MRFILLVRLTICIASEKYKQGFDFVNCGADIVAVTAWMSEEMTKLKRLVDKTVNT